MATTASTNRPGSGMLGPVRQIAAGDLDVGYVDVGPAAGRAVLLLHGWPYDIQSYRRGRADARPTPATGSSFRTCAATAPRSSASARRRRNGQQAALAADAVALLDALEIPEAIVGGFDWGARTAAIVAALWPERCTGLVSVSGYLIGSREANRKPLPPAAELAWWYQFYFATERGRLGYEQYRGEFARLIWRTASPRWAFDDATFERTAAALDNPDHVAIVIHNYRWRIGVADGEARFDDARGTTGHGSRDRRSDRHARGRRERRAAPGPSGVPLEIQRSIRPSAHCRRHRPQPAAGSAAGVRRRGHRGRRVLTRRGTA